MKKNKNKKKAIISRGEQDVTNISRSLSNRPPPITIIPTCRVVRRFLNTGAANATGTFLLSDGHNQFLVATTNILANSWVDMWRVKSVKMYAAFVVNTEGIASISPVSSDTSQNFMNDKAIVIQDTTSSTAYCAKVGVKFSKKIPSGSWHIASTTNASGVLFNWTISPEAVMDIEFEYVPNMAYAPAGYTVVIAAATAGRLYTRALTVSGGGPVFALNTTVV